jgi:hypothetical protein
VQQSRLEDWNFFESHTHQSSNGKEEHKEGGQGGMGERPESKTRNDGPRKEDSTKKKEMDADEVERMRALMLSERLERKRERERARARERESEREREKCIERQLQPSIAKIKMNSANYIETTFYCLRTVSASVRSRGIVNVSCEICIHTHTRKRLRCRPKRVNKLHCADWSPSLCEPK